MLLPYLGLMLTIGRVIRFLLYGVFIIFFLKRCSFKKITSPGILSAQIEHVCYDENKNGIVCILLPS